MQDQVQCCVHLTSDTSEQKFHHIHPTDTRKTRNDAPLHTVLLSGLAGFDVYVSWCTSGLPAYCLRRAITMRNVGRAAQFADQAQTSPKRIYVLLVSLAWMIVRLR